MEIESKEECLTLEMGQYWSGKEERIQRGMKSKRSSITDALQT